jgi:hypothetical protein
MAVPTERNEIRLGIITKCGAPSQMVNIEILKAAASLTAPQIGTKHCRDYGDRQSEEYHNAYGHIELGEYRAGLAAPVFD